MLLDPGPLRLYPDAEIPVPTLRPSFVAIVAAAAAQLDSAALQVSSAQGTMAGGGGLGDGIAAGLDLAAAADELDRQAAEPFTTIAGVAAGADVLDGELGGLTTEIARDLQNTDEPARPEFPAGDDRADVPPETFADWNAGTVALYREILDRDPTPQELAYMRGYYPDEFLRRDALVNGMVPGSGTPPPATAPPPASAPPPAASGGGSARDATQADVEAYLALHPEWRGAVEAFIARNPGDWHRVGAGVGLPDWAAFMATR